MKKSVYNVVEKQRMYQGLCKLLQQFDRILSGRKVRLVLCEYHSWSAWVLQQVIRITVPCFDVPKVMALNYHELGHIIYTRFPSEIRKQIFRSKELQPAMNILEDVRVENLMANRSDMFKAYLGWNNLISLKEFLGRLQYLEISKGYQVFIYLIFYGLKYLRMPTVVLRLRKLVEHYHKLSELETLVDKYILSREAFERWQLINKFVEVFPWSYELSLSSFLEGSNLVVDVESFSTGDGRVDDQMDVLELRVKEFSDELKDSEESIDGKMNVCDVEMEVGKRIEKFRDSLDGDVQKTVEKVGTLLNSEKFEVVNQYEGFVDKKDIQGEMKSTVRKYRRYLRTLKGIGMKWNWSKSGRLQVRQVMKGNVQYVKHLFKRRKNAINSGKLKVLIVVDKSGSMYDVLSSAMKVAWEIWMACKKENSEVKVLVFDNWVYEMKFSEKVYPEILSSGGTVFRSTFQMLVDYFYGNDDSGKMLLVLTDGLFSDGEMVAVFDLLGKLSKKGVVIWFGLVGTKEKVFNRFRKHKFLRVSNVSEKDVCKKMRKAFVSFLKNRYSKVNMG